MTFEFIIACRTSGDADLTEIRRALTELLARVLSENQNDFADDEIASTVSI